MQEPNISFQLSKSEEEEDDDEEDNSSRITPATESNGSIDAEDEACWRREYECGTIIMSLLRKAVANFIFDVDIVNSNNIACIIDTATCIVVIVIVLLLLLWCIDSRRRRDLWNDAGVGKDDNESMIVLLFCFVFVVLWGRNVVVVVFVFKKRFGTRLCADQINHRRRLLVIFVDIVFSFDEIQKVWHRILTTSGSIEL